MLYMKTTKKIVYMILICTLIFGMGGNDNVSAKEKVPYVVSQKKIAKNTSNVMSSYSLYDEIYIEFQDLLPNETYRIYRKESKKRWKVIKTFKLEAKSTEDGYNYEDENGICYNYDDYYEYVDKNVKENTCYRYKLYSCDTGKFSKVEKLL